MMSHEHEFLNPTAQQVVRAAHDATLRLNHPLIDTEHLLLGLLEMDDPIVTAILTHFDVAPKKLRKATGFVMARGRTPQTTAQMSDMALNVLRAAWHEARALRSDMVRPEHLLLGLLCERQGLAAGVLESHNITYDRTRAQIVQVQVQGAQRTAYAIEHAIRFQMTPTLNMVSRDMTAAALAGTLDPMIGREEELERAMQVLARRTKNNPVLIGEAGVGKTAIAEGLAYRIIQGKVPEHLLNQRVVALDVGLLTIGTKYRGDFEERLKRVLAEIVAAHNLIIVVDELHTLIGAGVAEGSVDAANLLKPILARGDFRCMGTTTMADYKKTIKRDPALERRFQPIVVRATTDEETLQVLNGLRERYEKFHRVSITPGALRAAVKLSSRYVQDRQQPDKAIDLMDEAAARLCVGRSVLPARVRELRERLAILRDDKDNAIEYEDFPRARALWKEEQGLRTDLQSAEDEWHTWHTSASTPQVTEQEIATVVAAWTGVPAVQLDAAESERLLHLEDELHARIIGQEEAVSAVARAIRRGRAELRDPRRPIGSFVFVGPTGVGKTELARALAATLFGDSDALITFDMSEFQEAHYAARLVGAPPGYVGFDQAGKLTEAVRRKPYSVVLFDEIEKAHPRVYDLLLQVLEDGSMSDAKGRKVDFRNTVIIMTSNAGMHYLTSRGTMGFARATDVDAHDTWMSEQVIASLKEVFRPEMLNRIDATVLFRPLTRTQMRRIADIFIQRVERQLAEKQISLTFSEAARDLIAMRGFDRQYGARPLRRTIQTLLE
ncbi:MAG: ATP-dependent Clp protease ATP-binding subunit, partial [Ktedonobacterales bacterium]|nr:ATP-dependent Clp protease ATP-binding subunit [Ktedonobacterales bacterium]